MVNQSCIQFQIIYYGTVFSVDTLFIPHGHVCVDVDKNVLKTKYNRDDRMTALFWIWNHTPATPNKHSDIYSFGILKLMWTKSDHNNCILTFVVTLHVTRGPSPIYPICHSGCCCCRWCFLKSVALRALMLFTKHENMFPFAIIS